MEKVRTDKDQDLLFMTVGMYKMFLANGPAGLEAKALYEHLMFTARLQETNQVHANDRYLKNGLRFGEKKVKAAKKFLADKGLIEYIQERGEHGQMGRTYIKVNFRSQAPRSTDQGTGGADSAPPAEAEASESPKEENSNTSQAPLGQFLPQRQEPAIAVSRPTGQPPHRCQNTNALSSKGNALREKGKAAAGAPGSLPELISKARDYYLGLYRERFGSDPAWQQKWDDRIKVDLERYGASHWRELVDLIFQDKVPAIRDFTVGKKAGFGYGVVSSQLNLTLEYLRDLKSRELPEYKVPARERASPEEVEALGLRIDGNGGLLEGVLSRVQKRNHDREAG